MTVEEINLEVFSQFDDEEVIDLNDLPLTKDVGEIHKSGRVQSDTRMNSSGMMLKEMSIVKARIGFDEQQFRNDCQKLQTAVSGEFKRIVDSIYDSLDALVADYSKQMYQIQVENLKAFEEDLAEVRKINIEAATISQLLSGFCANMQEAFRHAFSQ